MIPRLAFDLWTDGASEGRAACRGGWAAILVECTGGVQGNRLALSGWAEGTTSNRMELTAVIQGLQALGGSPAMATIHTDSAYVKNAMVRGWPRMWRHRDWLNAEGKPVANRDLWEQLDALCRLHTVKWHKVRGHSFHELNNLADEMAVRAKRERRAETLLI